MSGWFPWQQILKRLLVCLAGFSARERASDCRRVFAFETLEQRLPFAAGMVDVGAQPTGALTGKIIYTSAGHGWQWSDAANRWATDRGNVSSLVEDFGNQDQLTYYVDFLHKAGATVVPMRPVGRQLNEVVVDNDSAGVTFTGSWANNTAGPRWYDEDYGANLDAVKYRFANVNATTETATATFTPNIPASGMYPVYTWVPFATNRTNQLYRVNHSGGTTEVRVDHRNVGNGWVYLGTYHFASGSSATDGSVTISNRSSAGGSVVIADAIRFGNGMGDVPWNTTGIGSGNVSGFPREDEGSVLWAWRSVGQGTDFTTPSTVIGTNNVNAPIRMAEQMNADTVPYGTSVYIGFHSNATTGNPATATATGAIGLISASAPTPNQDDLALFTGRQINVDMRALNGQFEHDWSTRTTNTLTGSFGEISNSWAVGEFDATIIEVGFHDTPSDNELMRDGRVRQQLARSTYEATLEHLFTNFGTTTRPINVTAPSPPRDVSITSTQNGNVVVRWSAGLSSTGGFAGVNGSPATGFRVYASSNGYGFDGGTFVAGATTTSLTLTGYDPTIPYFFKVVAENTGGQSLASEVITVTPNGGDRQVLIVSGFDRIDRSQNFKQPYAFGGTTTDRVWENYGNSRDYTVPVQAAIQAARPGIRVDSASNEAVINGVVNLADYDAVIWILGNESVANQTFSIAEQNLVNQYIASGGDLMVTGSEVAWDLDSQNNGRTFFRDTLGASFVSDNAGTYVAASATGGIFAGLSNITFSNGASFSSLDGQTYNVSSADVLNPQPGSVAALRYGSSTGSVAAIQKPGTSGRGSVVTFGFPFETIVSPSSRSQLMDRVLGFFSVTPIVVVPPRVTDIIVASSLWTPAMIDAVDGLGRGAGNRLGLSLVGSQQLASLPWNNIDRIYIRFNKSVSTSFNTSNMTLRGTNVTNYMTSATVAYGVAGTDVGTITLGSPIRNDSLLLTLRTTIVDAGGVALDGEWIDRVSLQSGNGTAGGVFNFRMNVLPGDVNNSLAVDTSDIQLILTNQQRGVIPRDLATARLDIDGNGVINTTDMNAALRVRNTRLPSPPPALPPSPISGMMVLPLFATPSMVTPLAATTEQMRRATTVQGVLTQQTTTLSRSPFVA
jgi:hypothetical protein